MSWLAGIDIGGTKCAVCLGRQEGETVEICWKEKFPTPSDPHEAVARLVDGLAALLNAHPEVRLEAVGVSCGGPLDSKTGLILCPPNLPNWDRIDVVHPFEERFGVPAAVQNDANACALAEWLWGAGRGSENMIFLTFGTGLGAGLILDGRLYSGACDMAGEAGHIRLAEDGPVGYGKRGSFEGFCSGGGVGRHAVALAKEWIAEGKETLLVPPGHTPDEITAALVGEAAAKGDALALRVWEETGRKLGRGLAILIDLINPERIVIGSIFLRQEALLRGPMEEEIAKEALSYSAAACRVVPAGLGEAIGDYAALSVAGNLLRTRGEQESP